MNTALVVLCPVLLILGVIGWVGYISRGRRIGVLLKEKVGFEEATKKLEALLKGSGGLKICQSIVAHGHGGERVTIEAYRLAARSDEPWTVSISGRGTSQTFHAVGVYCIDGVPTAVLRVESTPNPKRDHTYPRVESIIAFTR